MRRARIFGLGGALTALPLFAVAFAEPLADAVGSGVVPPSVTDPAAAKARAAARAKANQAKSIEAKAIESKADEAKAKAAIPAPAAPVVAAPAPAPKPAAAAPAPAAVPAAPAAQALKPPAPVPAARPAPKAPAFVPATAAAIAVPVAAPPAAVLPAAPAPDVQAAAIPSAAAAAADDTKARTDPTVVIAADDPELKKADNIKPGSPQDKRPAKKLFGAAKGPAALAARAIGGYARGCLAGGKALAIDGPEWQAMRLSRNRNYGHPKLIALLERFAKEMREKENWPGLLIGDLAQPRGGPMLTGHKSHQIGLDADIWFRPMPAKRMTPAERETTEPLLLAKDRGTEVITANWNEGFVRLVRRAAKYPDVERVFLHPAIKKALCAAAGEDRDWLRKVRPMWLHNYHFHVRMGCLADSPTCVPQKAVETEGDGCGKELEDWLKLVSRVPKVAPTPPPTAPVKPSKPAPPLMLKDLPPECVGVLAAADAKQKPAAAPPAEGTPAAPNAQAAQR